MFELIQASGTLCSVDFLMGWLLKPSHNLYCYFTLFQKNIKNIDFWTKYNLFINYQLGTISIKAYYAAAEIVVPDYFLVLQK